MKVATIGPMDRWPTWLRRLSLMSLVVALPVLLITSNVWWAFNSLPLYEYGFSRNQVSQATGLASGELRRIAGEFIAYFRSPDELLDIQVTVSGQERPLFSEREVVHMRDVKGLVRGVLGVRNGVLALLSVYVVGGFVLGRRAFPEVLARHLRVAGAATAGGVLVVGVLLAVAFQPLFRLFHMVSFRNPFWMLDPSRDYLVQLFPFRFFFEATLLIALVTVVEGLLVAGVAWGWLRFLRARGSSAPGPG